MAVQTGTSTDYIDLLNDLVTFATANNWVLEKTDSISGSEERYLRGPGSVTEAPVYVNVKTGFDVGDSHYYWEIRGATSFDTNEAFAAQPNTQANSVYKLLRNSTIDYWFFVSDRRIIVIAKMGTVYVSTYAGFFLPFANPREYPFPLYIASSYSEPDIFSNSENGFRAFTFPSQDNAFMRSSAGVWEVVYNRSTGTSGYSTRTDDGFFMGPVGGSSSADNSNMNSLDVRPPPNDSNLIFTIPFTLVAVDKQNGAGHPGILDGVFWVPSSGMNAEQTFNSPSDKASQTLTATANFADSETVVIGAKTYTFQTTLTNTDGNVLIGSDAEASLNNLANAINLGPGVSSTYATDTTINTDVTASVVNTDMLEVVSRSAGTAANSLAVSETGANASWGAGTLAGGGANVQHIVFIDINRVNEDSFFAVRNT